MPVTCLPLLPSNSRSCVFWVLQLVFLPVRCCAHTFWLLYLVLSLRSVTLYWVDVRRKIFSLCLRGRRRRSAALLNQSAYTERSHFLMSKGRPCYLATIEGHTDTDIQKERSSHNDASNNSSFAAGTCLPSRCLATIGGYPCSTQTDGRIYEVHH
jgi:hypothetical protein